VIADPQSKRRAYEKANLFSRSSTAGELHRFVQQLNCWTKETSTKAFARRGHMSGLIVNV